MEIEYGGLQKRITVRIRPADLSTDELVALIKDGVQHLLITDRIQPKEDYQAFREFLADCLDKSK